MNMKSTRSYIVLLILIALAPFVTSCFTGVESTKKITEKDVAKVVKAVPNDNAQLGLKIYRDSLPVWKIGKRFYVCDKQARLIFANSANYNLDTVNFEGKHLQYKGNEVGSILDNRNTINILLADDHNTYVYPTAKTIDEFNSGFTIPFLIDEDMIQSVASQLEGKDVYIKTSIWYNDISQEMIAGRKFIKVRITHVLPGNKVLPIKVEFTASDTGENAFVWMSSQSDVMRNRDFDSLFSLTDVHLHYPTITNDNWNLIVKGDVAVGMTKDECRLALGAPKSVDQRPFYDGVKEYWYYDGGAYLIFDDGLLKSFRK